ncbi:MAG: hypothetical protein FD143_425 [Ignavibacteria bacterium]|nr:MAG: hypothetical protein FD143_425 [Ignavibacteria bacterium]KAF0160359.1 MAG: hypothetical protein FD188_1861 [Ignavibacteria bacterium]
MSKHDKILNQILRGTSDNNILFNDLVSLLLHLDFELRIKESHHIFYRNDLEEILNL